MRVYLYLCAFVLVCWRVSECVCVDIKVKHLKGVLLISCWSPEAGMETVLKHCVT